MSMEMERSEREAGALDGGVAGSGKGGEELEERRARYRALMDGEFKELHAAELQEVIDRWAEEIRGLRETLEAQRPVIERLMDWFGVGDGDVRTLAATLENEEREYAARQEAQTRQEQLDQERWLQEAEEARADYPELTLERESEDPLFMALLRSGVSVRQAYEAVHMDAVKERAARQAALERERALTQHIRARGARPAENGAAAQNGLRTRTDVERMTREERAEAARRAMRGERITFR